jgi:hypothetical protein
MSKINDLLKEGIEAKQRVKDLHKLISDEVNEDASLAGLTSSSKTAIWRLWLYVFAALSWIQEQTWDIYKREVDEIINKGIPGTTRWLANEVLKFQHGDPLSFDSTTGKYFYADIDGSKRVVKRVAISTNASGSTIKAAGEDLAGNAIPLEAEALNSLRAYVKEIQFAGATLSVVSYAADLLKLKVEVYYNALRPLNQIKTEVNEAILSYLSGLNFNGILHRSKLMDAIQEVDGIEDVVMVSIQGKPETGIYSELQRIYTPMSGYINIDSAYPLTNEDVIRYRPA